MLSFEIQIVEGHLSSELVTQLSYCSGASQEKKCAALDQTHQQKNICNTVWRHLFITKMSCIALYSNMLHFSNVIFHTAFCV